MNGTRGLVIAVLVSLIVGCSIGMMGGILLARFAPLPPGLPFAWRHPGGGPPGGEPPVPPHPLLGLLERRLGVTVPQRARIEAILDSSRVAYATVRESTHAAIWRELTPEQREAWERMEVRMEARIMRERRGGTPRSPWRMRRP